MRPILATLVAALLCSCTSDTPTEAPAAPESAAPAPAAAPAAAPAEAAAEASGDADEGSAEPALAEPPPPPDPDAALRAAVAGHGPIDGALRDVIWGVPQDPPPELLNATREDLEGRHYLTCDELNLHVWYEQLRDIGGAYAGVGSDQAYTFIGWMKPQIAWLTDYDPWVRSTHKIYRLAFEQSDSIEAFRAFWSDENEDASWAAVEARWAGDDDLEFMRAVWRQWRGRIERRLRRYQRVLRNAEIPSFLTDEATYTWVREFVQTDRVRPLLANLLDETALRSIGDVSRRLEVPIRAFYLSNAEDYWDYPEEFRVNFESLHFDERSLILRTNASKRRNGDYRYASQPAQLFVQWLRADGVDEIDDIWEHPRVEGEDHIPVSFLDDPPPAPETP